MQTVGSDPGIVTSNYVLVETYVLTQRRLGSAAVHVLTDDLLAVIEVEWIGRGLRERAVWALIVANRPDLSLVNAVSFEAMRRRGLDRAFAFDRHFEDAGFSLSSASDAGAR